jgi:hypothetical protein
MLARKEAWAEAYRRQRPLSCRSLGVGLITYMASEIVFARLLSRFPQIIGHYCRSDAVLYEAVLSRVPISRPAPHRIWDNGQLVLVGE